jgi:hypothetical protein
MANAPDDDNDLFAPGEADENQSGVRYYDPDQKAVLFVDLLGFGALTESCVVDSEVFAVLDRPNENDFLRVRWESIEMNRLVWNYMHFNMAVDGAITEALLTDTKVTAITFSDSAFIATDSV